MDNRFTILLLLALAAQTAWLTACTDKPDTGYDPERGLYRVDELQLGEDASASRVDELLQHGEALEKQQHWADAAQFYQSLARATPLKLRLALEARIRRTRCLANLGDYYQAHVAMSELVDIYKEFLQLTYSQSLWEGLRQMWYEQIALGLFFKNSKREELAEDLDPAIRAFSRIYREELRGQYSARCLLRIGDACYAKSEYEKAKDYYLRVVKDYPDFQQHNEHEEALYKAAAAMLGTMKGALYNIDRLIGPGSEDAEKGALDLLDDYLRVYRAGAWADAAAKLRARVLDLLCQRDITDAEVYEKQDHPRAAYYQYEYVVKVWGDPVKFPDVQHHIERVRQRLREMGPLPEDGK